MRSVVLVAIAVAIFVLLVCALGSAPALAVAVDFQTEVSVRFMEKLYFDQLEFVGMDIDFGEHPLPLGDTLIPATDGDHTLRVCDGRVNAGGWQVYAVMTDMTGDGEPFTAQLALFDPMPVPGIAFTFAESGPGRSVRVTTTPSSVMTAETALVQGDYDLRCTATNTRLYFTAAQAARVEPNPYTATITWTLMTAVP